MSEQSNEYSVEWFRWMYINNPKWLGTQALRLWEHYAALEIELEAIERIVEAVQQVMYHSNDDTAGRLAKALGIIRPAQQEEKE